MTRTERRMRDTRERIIQCALVEFGEKGYAKARIGDIAEKVDIGYGTFYQYFKSKKDLLMFVGEELCNRVGDYGYLKTHKGLKLWDRLYYGMLGILRFFLDNETAYHALCDAEAADKVFSSYRSRIHEKLFERISRDIHYFIQKNYCREEVDETTIVAITCMIDGYGNRLMNTGEAEADTVARSLTDIAYRALFRDNIDDLI